ncbi:uncharacterized protein LOC110617858 [Manihot esculenta]|uniref:uncharacterized protein LOC110617858 n=1 Tax=Manihot esculenta TaxID=3983 RepID=UPI001CC61932|nr:uncharacterized protein LOC110617858 [Manihot esculenta]
MTWLFNSIQSDDPDSSLPSPSPSPSAPNRHPHDSPAIRGGGVKEDFSVIGDSIACQFRGVANFLAPPPSPSSSSSSLDKPLLSSSSPSQSQSLLGICNDLAELGAFLQFQSGYNEEEDEDGDDYVTGITDEVIGFVQEISIRPECWTDFPLSLESDFKMSDAQREHASPVEHMVPNLRAFL